jgi:Domain of unknown function (DUF4145)
MTDEPKDAPPPPMRFPTLHEYIEILGRSGHAAHVLIAAAQLENALRDLIKANKPKLSNRFYRGLAAKIDLAFGLGEIDAKLQADLHVIRDIRNKFAHTPTPLHFDSPEAIALLQNFANYETAAMGVNPMAYFFMKVDDCFNELRPRIASSELVRALESRSEKRQRY